MPHQEKIKGGQGGDSNNMAEQQIWPLGEATRAAQKARVSLTRPCMKT